jgi:hypothetical protein
VKCTVAREIEHAPAVLPMSIEKTTGFPDAPPRALTL